MTFRFDPDDYIWVSPLIAMVVAQVLKPILVMVQLRQVDWQRMRQSGGMPSSHTALVVALVVVLARHYGGDNPALTLALFVAAFVMYDAAGVRWQTGRQAAVLNRLLRDLQQHPQQISEEQQRIVREIQPLSVVKVPWWLIDWPVLDEHVGHKPIEVLGGAIVGAIVGLLFP
ncbi:MAG: divergent PAP2 family protein [Alicyclobacillus sp.]|nr:divergent PAP2 family protein [Alicyclobacillus sp.]